MTWRACTPPHNDMIIITLQAENLSVAQVLIDPGSGANLIFSSTLHHMGISDTDISPSDIVMVGLNKNETPR